MRGLRRLVAPAACLVVGNCAAASPAFAATPGGSGADLVAFALAIGGPWIGLALLLVVMAVADRGRSL